MKLTKRTLTALAVAGLAALTVGFGAPKAQAAPVLFSGFDNLNRTLNTNSYTTFGTGQTYSDFTDSGGTNQTWTVTSGNIDVVNGSYWTAQSGANSIDLNGYTAGTLSTSFATVVGQTYDVTFWVAANTDAASGSTFTATASTAGGIVDATDTFNTVGNHTPSNPGWKQMDLVFTGDSTSTLLSFASDNTGAQGVALDTVSVNAVPELGTSVGFGSLVLFGGLALLRRRTRQTV